MEDGEVNTCALLDSAKERICRGRFDRREEGVEIKFTPASKVTLEEMGRVAFLWPDDGDAIPVSNVRPDVDDDLHYRMDVDGGSPDS